MSESDVHQRSTRAVSGTHPKLYSRVADEPREEQITQPMDRVRRETLTDECWFSDDSDDDPTTPLARIRLTWWQLVAGWWRSLFTGRFW